MTQKTYLGHNSLDNISQILAKHKPKKIILITGKKSFDDSGANQKLMPYLKDYEVIRFNEFTTNPKIEDVIKGIERINDENPDFIISIGGGSVIDIAKQINVLSFQSSFSKKNILDGTLDICNPGLPSIVIPTTSGTGSEATHFAVLFIEGTKYSVASDLLIPDYAIVDPSLTENLPKHVVATTAMDALCQSVESFWSVKSTEESRTFAYSSIKLILENVINAYNGDVNAKAKMSEAAFLSGKAINISYTTAAHSLSYPLTTFYGVSHGHAVALTLGSFFVINSNLKDYTINDPRGSDFLESIMNDIFSLFNVKDWTECKIKFRDILIHIGLEIDLFKIGINTQSDINKIVDNVNLDRLNNNPIKLNRNDLKKIFTDLMNDKL